MSSSLAEKRPRIAFVSPGDPRDIRLLSGLPYFMMKALQKHCGDVYLAYAEPLPAIEMVGKAINKASQLLLKKRYAYKNGVVLAKLYAREVRKKLLKQPCDVIFATRSGGIVAFLEHPAPIVFTSDTTFALLSNYYKGLSNLSRLSLREGNLITQRAIAKASVVFYPSTWAATSAIKDYHADAGKIHVIPSGANLEENQVPARELILSKRKSSECRLLFVGVDWERKGGDIAYEALLALEKMGIAARLIVCGCTPPAQCTHPRMQVLPFLNKQIEAQRRELARLYLTSDFLFLPTRSDTFGVTFCEASAFGLPVIATDTGGVASAVKPGENGVLLPLAARGADYAATIHDLYQNDERYYALVKSSQMAYEERLNWDAWARAVRKLIAQVI